MLKGSSGVVVKSFATSRTGPARALKGCRWTSGRGWVSSLLAGCGQAVLARPRESELGAASVLGACRRWDGLALLHWCHRWTTKPGRKVGRLPSRRARRLLEVGQKPSNFPAVYAGIRPRRAICITHDSSEPCTSDEDVNIEWKKGLKEGRSFWDIAGWSLSISSGSHLLQPMRSAKMADYACSRRLALFGGFLTRLFATQTSQRSCLWSCASGSRDSM